MELADCSSTTTVTTTTTTTTIGSSSSSAVSWTLRRQVVQGAPTLLLLLPMALALVQGHASSRSGGDKTGNHAPRPAHPLDPVLPLSSPVLEGEAAAAARVVKRVRCQGMALLLLLLLLGQARAPHRPLRFCRARSRPISPGRVMGGG